MSKEHAHNPCPCMGSYSTFSKAHPEWWPEPPSFHGTANQLSHAIHCCQIEIVASGPSARQLRNLSGSQMPHAGSAQMPEKLGQFFFYETLLYEELGMPNPLLKG